MTGQPAARITDKVAKGVIVTGSATVLIGSQGGLACSVCPGGVTVANPVNPQLGAKVLVGGEDLDFALPGALPVVWQRQYSSYVNAEHGVACGLLGYGWKLPQQISLELSDQACLLLDAAGRVIRTAEDVGIIVLLDDRFQQYSYRRLFPREWEQVQPVTVDTVAKKVERFWDAWLWQKG